MRESMVAIADKANRNLMCSSSGLYPIVSSIAVPQLYLSKAPVCEKAW
jgi:hypothetical protein